MIISGWLNTAITVVMFAALAAVTIHYFRPKKQEEVDRDEQPKWSMLRDDDE